MKVSHCSVKSWPMYAVQTYLVLWLFGRSMFLQLLLKFVSYIMKNIF